VISASVKNKAVNKKMIREKITNVKDEDFELSVTANEYWKKLNILDKYSVHVAAIIIKRDLDKPPDSRTEDETIRDYVKDLNNHKWLDPKTNYEKYLVTCALTIYLFLLRRFREPAPLESRYVWIMNEKYIDLYFTVKKQVDEKEKQNNKYYI
jgi:hypothetical protein